MDTDDHEAADVAIVGDINTHRMATSIIDVILDKESKEACKNRLRDYFITKYTEDFINVYIVGKKEIRRVVAVFATETVRDSAINETHEELKINEEALPPSFSVYDPMSILAEVKQRSIVVTDIPFFFQE